MVAEAAEVFLETFLLGETMSPSSTCFFFLPGGELNLLLALVVEEGTALELLEVEELVEEEEEEAWAGRFFGGLLTEADDDDGDEEDFEVV